MKRRLTWQQRDKRKRDKRKRELDRAMRAIRASDERAIREIRRALDRVGNRRTVVLEAARALERWVPK